MEPINRRSFLVRVGILAGATLLPAPGFVLASSVCVFRRASMRQEMGWSHPYLTDKPRSKVDEWRYTTFADSGYGWIYAADFWCPHGQYRMITRVGREVKRSRPMQGDLIRTVMFEDADRAFRCCGLKSERLRLEGFGSALRQSSPTPSKVGGVSVGPVWTM